MIYMLQILDIYASNSLLSFYLCMFWQEIIWRATDSEIEILEKILMYVRNMESVEGGDSSNLKKWVVMKLKMDGYDASLCKTSWVSTFGRLKGIALTHSYP